MPSWREPKRGESLDEYTWRIYSHLERTDRRKKFARRVGVVLAAVAVAAGAALGIKQLNTNPGAPDHSPSPSSSVSGTEFPTPTPTSTPTRRG